MDQTEEHNVDLSGMSRENLEDTVEYTQQMLQDLLEMLGQAWEELDALKRKEAKAQQRVPEQTTGTAEPMPLKGVLIVDDSKVLQLRMKSILESLNHEIVGFAEDGAKGVEMALRKLPKLVIMDYQMPEMDGLEALIRIKNSRPQIKVVICAGTITKALGKMLVQAGADQIIAKPIQLNTFVDIIHKCMS